MFEAFEHQGLLLGHKRETNRSLCFYGSRHLTFDQMKGLFPKLRFQSVKQVHGNKIVAASKDLVEADGHWTSQFDEALTIQTADCVPLLIEGKTEIQALHAGWRGVESGILIESLKRFPKDELSGLKIFAGPRISKRNFEVGKDVAHRLLKADPFKDSRSILDHPNPEKSYVDLDQILKNQALSVSEQLKIHFLPIDTYENMDYPSYRRDGKMAGRLFSFIARLKEPR